MIPNKSTDINNFKKEIDLLYANTPIEAVSMKGKNKQKQAKTCKKT